MPDDHTAAIQALVDQWMLRARSDLTVAQMTEDERISPEILVFHAQQAAEKAFKALLIRDQVEFPRTHVIATLLSLSQTVGYEIPDAINDAVVLTRYAVATRYPSEEELVSRQEAREAAIIASRVLEWVEARLATRNV